MKKNLFVLCCCFFLLGNLHGQESKKPLLIISLTSLSQKYGMCPDDRVDSGGRCFDGLSKVKACKLGFMVKNQLNRKMTSFAVYYSSYSLGSKRIAVSNRTNTAPLKYMFWFYNIPPGGSVVSNEKKSGENATFGYIYGEDCDQITEIDFQFDPISLSSLSNGFDISKDRIKFESKVSGVAVKFDGNDFEGYKNFKVEQERKEADWAESYRKKGLPFPSAKVIEKCAGYLRGYTKINDPFSEANKKLIEEANDFLKLLGDLEKMKAMVVKVENIGDQIQGNYFNLMSQSRGLEAVRFAQGIKNVINTECAEYGSKYGFTTYQLSN